MSVPRVHCRREKPSTEKDERTLACSLVFHWVLVTDVGHQEFDQTLSYIKTWTYICPAYVLNMSLSNLRLPFGLEIKVLSSSGQDFVLLVQPMSSFCPLNRLKFTEKLQDIF